MSLKEFNRWADNNDLRIAEYDTKPELLWIDIETTGLVRQDVILEIGIILSDIEGYVIPESSYSTVVFEDTDHYNQRIDGMSDLVVNMHRDSDLLREIDNGQGIPVNAAQNQIMELLNKFCPEKNSVYLAGSSVHFDGGVVANYMKTLDDHIHYRQVNVSTLKVLCAELNPRVARSILAPMKHHRVMDDLVDSLHEYYHYIDNFLFIGGDDE